MPLRSRTPILRIAHLSDAPQHAPALARWHHEQWSQLLPHWSAGDALRELAGHGGRVRIDTTHVALYDGELAGSVSLVAEDHPQLARFSPWLASLYVHPALRGRGIGEALVATVVANARVLGLRALYLFTEDGQRFYERLGWAMRQHELLPGGRVVVMHVDPATGRAPSEIESTFEESPPCPAS